MCSAHQDAFINGGYQGDKLAIASQAHTGMGYNFIVAKVGLTTYSSLGNGTAIFPTIQLDVTLKQVGVAPFYYPLSLFVDCPDLNSPLEQKGVESIIVEGDTKLFSFRGIPATQSCLNATSLQMRSRFDYSGRPIRFAQGLDGTVKLSFPIPPNIFSRVNSTTDIPSVSPLKDRSLFPSIFRNVETPVLPTVLTEFPTPANKRSFSDPTSSALPVLIHPNGSSTLTANDIHAFNTDLTPSLMKLEAERRQQQQQFQNRVIGGVVVGCVLSVAVLIMLFRLRKRQVRATNPLQRDPKSRPSVSNESLGSEETSQCHDVTLACGSSDCASSIAEA